jgi:hypothetical protein
LVKSCNLGSRGPLRSSRNKQPSIRKVDSRQYQGKAQWSINMAFKTVVTNNFVEAMNKFVRALSTQKGALALAMLVPSESGLSDKWNLVLSAKWIDQQGLQATIPTISSLLRTHVAKIHAAKIGRISVLRTTDMLVTDLMSLGITPGTAYRVDSLALTMREINDSIILVAQKIPPQSSLIPHAIKTRA